MPLTSLVCASYHLVVTTCFGEVGIKDVQADSARIRRHPEFHPDFRQLMDLSHVVTMDLNFRDLYQLKHAGDPFSNEGRRAVFAPTDLSFGMSRMYQTILNTAHFEVFRSLADALAWIELDPAVLEDILQNVSLDATGCLTPQPDRSDA